MKFGWPHIMAAIEERQQKIAEGLSASDNSHEALAQAQDQVNEELKVARANANEIIEQAHQRANHIVDATKTEAIAEDTRQKALAQNEIDAAANRAREDLRKQVSALAVTGAEKLLHREIDANAPKALHDALAAQLSAHADCSMSQALTLARTSARTAFSIPPHAAKFAESSAEPCFPSPVTSTPRV